MKSPLLLTAAVAFVFVAVAAHTRAAAQPLTSGTSIAPGIPIKGKPERRKFPESMTNDENEASVESRPFVLALPRELVLTPLPPTLKDLAITPSLTYESDIAGNVSGGRRQGGSYDDNIGASLAVDLEKLLNLPGASFLISMSQRNGDSLSQKYVGNTFTIQQVYGGQTFHLIDVEYKQAFYDDKVEFALGRIAAGDDFLVSTYDYLFMQNGFDGNPVGIFLNSPGMTAYPNAAWGARVKVRPTDNTYFMAGIYNGDPTIRANEYHGANLSMDGPAFAIAEFGYKRNWLATDSPYLGHYKVGAWYDDSLYGDYRTGAMKRGNWGVYGLLDQVVLAWGDPKGNRGLGVFGSFLASPDQSVSEMPWFFTTGVVARGVCDSRPRDLIGFGAVFGHFSHDLADSEQRQQLLDPAVTIQSNETTLELTYRYSMYSGGCFIQPDLQYIIHPGGTPTVEDALVLGCQIGVDF